MSFAGVLFPIEVPRITLPFADRTFKEYRYSPHRGVDLAPWPGSTGRPIRASTVGRIVAANPNGSQAAIGNEIVVETSLPFPVGAIDISGQYRQIAAREPFFLRYGHLRQIHQTSGEVAAGDILGTIGESGKAFGPHLHLEVRLGKYEDGDVVDPMHIFIASIVGLRGELQSL